MSPVIGSQPNRYRAEGARKKLSEACGSEGSPVRIIVEHILLIVVDERPEFERMFSLHVEQVVAPSKNMLKLVNRQRRSRPQAAPLSRHSHAGNLERAQARI